FWTVSVAVLFGVAGYNMLEQIASFVGETATFLNSFTTQGEGTSISERLEEAIAKWKNQINWVDPNTGEKQFPCDFPSFKNCDRDTDIGREKSGDTVLFAGLLCLTGEEAGCRAVSDSQFLGADPDKYGKWFRSPILKGDLSRTSFSKDQVSGVLFYFLATTNRNLAYTQAKSWIDWIYRHGRQVCASSDCSLTPAIWQSFYWVLKHNHWDDLIKEEMSKQAGQDYHAPAEYEARTANMNSNLHLTAMGEVLRQAMGIKNYGRGGTTVYEKLIDGDIGDCYIEPSCNIDLFEGEYNCKIETGCPGDEEGVADIIYKRDPSNPMFQLIKGVNSENIFNNLINKCAVVDTDSYRNKKNGEWVYPGDDWAWRRNMTALDKYGHYPWYYSSAWDCVLIARFLLKGTLEASNN
ncbi:hypothetical protein WDW89_21390, partial [Deltaproteobacteria bacterium TL4]